MPCEGCNVQFTVFRRKRICTDCRRYYCSHCLTNRNASTLCERCAIFAKRPLLKIDLLQLKPKDLIFYLQSKHISTKGCVEKEELVGLILTHVNQNETPNLSSSNGSKYSEPGEAERPFENIKQTCQNFFNNLTDKLTTDFNFDTKASTASTAATGSTAPASSGPSSHISEQPRISTREIPTYSSYQNQPPSVQPQPCQQPPPQQQPSKSNNSTPTSPVSSPIVSLSSISSQSTAPRSPQPHATDDQRGSRSDQSSERGAARSPQAHLCARNRLLETVLNDEPNGSECECSDDELITTFKDRSSREGAGTSSSPTTSSPVDNQVPGPSASGPKSSPSLQIGSYEDSSESSFEELGAIGGISDDNKTDCNTQNETWQFINKPDSEGGPSDGKKQPPTGAEDEGSAGGTTSACNSTDLALVSSESSSGPSRTATIFPTRPKRVTRRRSDGYLNRRRYAGDQVYHLIGKEQSVEEEVDEDDEDDEMNGRPQIWIRKRKCCEKCGKNKMSIKHHVMKLRRHLESANMSEADIKRELEEFLVYLDSRMRSVECSDVGSATSPYLDENDGIHVYAHTEEEEEGIIDPKAAANRFLNLNDFETLEDLENLTVKQLKQILTLNRVDYKGCCEKQELLERVSRLWKNLKSCPAIDKLPTDELCKICMDAPIECVILECGHMATCTNCGKVLSECPICRQYIVRVVRFFRA